MIIGTIIKLGNGFGTVVYEKDGTQHEAFFHASALKKISFSSLKIGDKVQITLRNNDEAFVDTLTIIDL